MQYDILRIQRNCAYLSSFDSREVNETFGIFDNQRALGKRKYLVIQRFQFLAFFGFTHIHSAPFNLLIIERVQGLAGFQHYKIRKINYVINGVYSHGF
ncbi:MAG: hypothetical protein A2940_01035 [Candidatus Wildermuthbacteria bacterium RIFCSPLOWO2_01_FULL_48_29]|uniref:Uncharacterized protein n=2 Tax=Candidatus Wildermuthiibacteriota TaxID=1817923 RepID=A0A1G2RKC0_9BACT|nr:MAG: hypothetical protein A2843_01140 [Candidatus Wildermuthbacteria bacterium RIFCSPHIGHO2_01_FULL_48_27b]OHA73294.1 MAG: hypothetical protein A2940_01035 [Candidatus Wildermuthbacteria bacterium RIFCSPLOWO2_01_FULL_48_29]